MKDVADNLGISQDLLFKWRGELRTKEKRSFPANGLETLTEQEEKIRDLKKRLKEAMLERDILKKAVVFFMRKLENIRIKVREKTTFSPHKGMASASLT